jgi:hypothetical protein
LGKEQPATHYDATCYKRFFSAFLHLAVLLESPAVTGGRTAFLFVFLTGNGSSTVQLPNKSYDCVAIIYL